MAVLLMFLASACFVSMSALVKGMGHALPLTELMFLRTMIAVPVLVLIVLKRGYPLLVHNKKVLLIRTLFGGVAMFGFYTALTGMPLAECVFIGRTQPLLLALLAPFVTGERAGFRVWIAIVLGLAGTALIMRPGTSFTAFALIALSAAFFSALAHLMVRILGRTDPAPVIVLNFTLLLGLASGGLMAVSGPVLPDFRQWLMIGGIALLASSGQFLLTRAYRMERAPRVAAASYASVVLSIVYGYIFWGETVSVLAQAGGALTVISGLYLMLGSRERGKEEGGR